MTIYFLRKMELSQDISYNKANWRVKEEQLLEEASKVFSSANLPIPSLNEWGLGYISIIIVEDLGNIGNVKLVVVDENSFNLISETTPENIIDGKIIVLSDRTFQPNFIYIFGYDIDQYNIFRLTDTFKYYPLPPYLEYLTRQPSYLGLIGAYREMQIIRVLQDSRWIRRHISEENDMPGAPICQKFAVRHLTPDSDVSCQGAIFDFTQQYVIIIRESKSGKLGFVKGGKKVGEGTIQCIRREACEEVGLVLDDADIRPAGTFLFVSFFIFLPREKDKIKLFKGSEVTEIFWMTKDELNDRYRNNRIEFNRPAQKFIPAVLNKFK